MKFRTEAAQAAYEEHIRVAGEQVGAMRRNMEDLATRFPPQSIFIHLNLAMQETSMLIDAHDRAVRLGTDVDWKWAELRGHLAICAQER